MEFIKAEKARQAENLKKLKKKPKTDEEDAKDAEELVSRTTSTLVTQMSTDDADLIESEIELAKTEWLMDNHQQMDAVAFEKLNRLKSILDIDVSEMDVIVRMDLDVPLTPFTPFTPLEEEFKELIEQREADLASETAKRKVKKSKKQIEEEAEQWRLYDEAKQARQEPWKTR